MSSALEANISQALGRDFRMGSQQGIGGGSINQASRIDGYLDNTEMVSFFIKFNNKERLPMFEAEAAGLLEMVKAEAITVPGVICSGIDGAHSYLVLEHLNFSAAKASSAQLLGQQLARLHQKTSTQYGWQQNNTIGSTPQINDWSESWIDFWREQRLGFQLELAKQNGVTRTLYKKGQLLLEQLDSFFVDYDPEPSLLHGDLWSGNYSFIENGEPVIFDPAVYYGDREADIAMTELFGGFPAEFYMAYNEVWPLDKGYRQRKTLYNLYHILNHFNLFGGGYAMQAENMIEQLSR
jgi:protein-ribulosamine 3-kinase